MNVVTAEAYWMGRDKLETPSQAIRDNANDLLARVNKFIALYALDTGNTVAGINSGWRPPIINSRTPGASKTSHHLTACAIDLSDADEAIDTYLSTQEGQTTLEVCGLFSEDPKATKRWAHLQSKPFGSYRSGGTRTFKI
jgi:hypothetical protein